MKSKLWRRLLGALLTVVVAIIAFLGYLIATHRRDYSDVPLPKISASTDPAVIAHGAYVAHAIAHCSACHGNPEFANKHQLSPDPNDLRGGYTLRAGPFGTFFPSNLTPHPETGIAKLSDAELARIIRHGVSRDGGYDPLMALAVGPMSDEDLTAVVSYLRSLPPIENAVPADEWGLLAKVLSRTFTPRMSLAPTYVARGGVSKERGEYLANGPALCFSCHTPVDKTAGFAEVGPRFSGALEPEPDSLDENFEVQAPN
ncbi:MAG: cytochrome c, partial [Myxococcota bacterium]